AGLLARRVARAAASPTGARLLPLAVTVLRVAPAAPVMTAKQARAPSPEKAARTKEERLGAAPALAALRTRETLERAVPARSRRCAAMASKRQVRSASRKVRPSAASS